MSDSRNKRSIGDAGEKIAKQYLIEKWWNIKEENYTIRWGEIDLIVEDDDYIVCIEVRAVNIVDDLMAYMTDKKLWFLARTFKTYLHVSPSPLQPRIDVIFVKDNKIWEVYENVTGN